MFLYEYERNVLNTRQFSIGVYKVQYRLAP